MKKPSTDPFWLFINLHSDSVKKLYSIDLLFLLCSLWYIGIQIPQTMEYFRTGVLIFFIIIVFTVINMRTISSCIASPQFYRMLPMNGKTVILKTHILLLAPFATVLFLILLCILIMSLFINIDTPDTIIKIGQIFTIFCTIRLLTLPTLLLIRKGILYLSAFYFLIIPLIFIVMVFNEFFWSRLPLPLMWDMATFITILFILELQIITKCK